MGYRFRLKNMSLVLNGGTILELGWDLTLKTFETSHSLFEKIQRSYSLHIDILDTTQTICSK